MSKKMIVESDPHQVRIAVLEDDRLTEIFVERHDHRGAVGNLYRGRVTRVLPGMQAAFVDIGLERDAFLYVSDVIDLELGEQEDAPPLVELPDNATEDSRAIEDDRAIEDNRAIEDDRAIADDRAIEDNRAIEELLRDGQEILVQVTKDPLANKGARVSTHLALPGRRLVLLPGVHHLGISRRIEEEPERERLRGLLDENGDHEFGWIVRTAGDGMTREQVAVEQDYLRSLWRRIQQSAEQASPPCLVHQDHDLALRVVRDMFTAEFSVLWVDGEEAYERIVEFLDQVQPQLVSQVKLDRREGALFDRFNIEREIEAALSAKVWLKSGGHLVINQTEALVAIDVNTGRFVGKHSLEDTVLKTNLEAVKEIVRQIRLRDLSGILIIDLIDMEEAEHRDQVFEALQSELQKDPARTKLLSISEFGVVELTRKRSHANLERLLTRSCPYCRGSGRIKSLATICLNVRREVLRHSSGRAPAREILLRVHPEVAQLLQTQERQILDELKLTLGANVLLQSDPELHHERFDVTDI